MTVTPKAIASSGPDRLGWFYALLAAVGFSFKAILVKLAYRHGADAETVLALRMAFSVPFFIAMAWTSTRRATTPITRRDGAWLAALGFCGYYLASYLDFLGLQYISAALERLILFVYPTLVVLLSALWLGHRLTARLWAALGLSYLGIGLAVTHDFRLAGSPHELAVGSALVFGSALSYALYLVGNARIVGRLGATRVAAFVSLVACGLALAQFPLLRPLSALLQPWPVYALCLMMALFSTVLPVWLVAEAIRRLGPGPVALSGSLGPVITLFLAWLLLGEALGAAQLAGSALVIVGVSLIGKR